MPLLLSSVVQDAASKKSNNLLLDTSDLAISQYSLLGQTPPRSAPGSPAIHARDPSAAPSEEAAPVVEEEAQTATADVCLQSDPELKADAKSDPSTTQSSDQSTALPSPVIVVSQEPDGSIDESSPEEPSCFEETREEVQLGTDAPSATADSDAGHEVCAPDAPADPAPSNPIPDSPDLSASTLSSPQATDVPAECAQSDQSAAPENSAPPDLTPSDQATSSYSPCTDNPVKISLGSLSEAIGCNPTAPSALQMMTQQTTDRAVYLTGEMKNNWEVERVKEEKQREEAEEEEVHERIKEVKDETGAGEGKEEEVEGERAEGQTGGEAQTGGEPVDEGCQSPESPAESTTALTRQREHEDKDEEQKGGELETEKRTEDEEEAEERDHEEKAGEKEKEEEELRQSPQSMELQPESDAELPLDSVAVIRELVTEITEVETVVRPCPSSSHTP